MRRRVLLLISQSPFDPASGSARVARNIAAALATRGFEVAALSTTASEGAEPIAPLPFLASLGCQVAVDRRPAVGKGRPLLRFAHRDVRYTMLDTGPLKLREWDFAHGAQFARTLVDLLGRFEPHVVLTYGGSPPEQTRRQLCREAGAAVVFSLQNKGYLHPLAFDDIDQVITPSRFLADLYRERIGLRSTPIVPPIEPEDTIAPACEPRFVTFVNPTPAKGVFFFARLADELAKRRPDIPLQCVQARGTAADLINAGGHMGLDLRRHRSLHIAPTLPRPRDIFTSARIVVVPSMVEEAFGLLAAEAALNGVPALVGPRGALPEAAADPSMVLPLPAELDEGSRVPPTAVEPWISAITTLVDDATAYQRAAGLARAAAERFALAHAADQYARVFSDVERHPGGVLSSRAEAPAGSTPPDATNRTATPPATPPTNALS